MGVVIIISHMKSRGSTNLRVADQNRGVVDNTMKMDLFNETCNSTFTGHQKNIVLIVKSGTGLISFILCLIAVSLVFYMRLYKNFTYRLAMYQILSSLCVTVVEVGHITLLNYDNHIYYHIACKSVSFLMEYAMWIKLLFTLCLVFHLFCLAVCLKNFKKLEIGYVLFSILFPLLFSWIPFIHNSYGVAGAWCWIRDWKDDCANEKYLEGIIEQFVLWYVPVFISLTLSVVAVFIILIVLAQRAYANKNPENEYLIENHERNQNKKVIKELLPLLAYPVIFYVLVLFPLVDRIHSAISPNASFELALVHSITTSLWGFFSSWALIIHILVMRQLKKKHRVQFKEQPITSVANIGNVIYTTYTEGSTNAGTKYSIPSESDIDNE